MTDVVDQVTVSGTIEASVAANHFGSNFLFDQDVATDGSVFDIISDATNAQTLRFPGGTLTETDFDPTSAADLAKLDQFIDYCASNELSAVIVLPTYRYFVDGSSSPVNPMAQAEIQIYVRHVLDLAPASDVSIQGFEIGNEFYQSQFAWSDAEFAQLQAEMTGWVRDEIGEEADIYIQAGRTEVENDAILDAFTQSSTDDLELSDVDGITTHLYYGATGGDLSRIGGVKSRLELLEEHWSEFNIDTIVTEWNTSESDNYGGNSSVYGLARLAALSRGFGDMIGYGVDTAMIWSTIAGGVDGRSTLAKSDGDILPTGYWYQLMSTTLIDTNIISDFGSNSAFNDENGSFSGYSYVFQGMGSKSNDYHVIYANGVDDVLNLDLDLSNLTASGSYVYATIIRNAGTTDPDNPHAEASLEVLTNLSSQIDLDLEAYEFVEINVVTGHGITLDTDMFNDIVDDLNLSSYADTVQTHGGNDTVRADAGDDQIDVGSGNDLAYGGMGNDTLLGGEGSDTLRGDAGNDVLYGEDGADILKGMSGNDVLYGGDQGDQLWGGTGSDTLFGESGWDTLKGENGNDTLNGGGGNDKLYGGSGTDTFVFEGNFGNDKVYDFQSSEYIDLTAFTEISNFNNLNLSQDGGAAVITIGDNHIKIIGFDSNDLIADNFLF